MYMRTCILRAFIYAQVAIITDSCKGRGFMHAEMLAKWNAAGIYIYISMYVCVCVYICIFFYTYMYIYIYINICVHINIYTYIYT